MDYKDKVVIVTGSSSGIGESCARKLLDLDAKVAGFDIRPSKNTNGNYRHYLVDVRDNNGIRVAVDDVERRFEKIDALINCAGIFSNSKPFYEINIEEWDNVISTNLTGTFLCSRYVAKKMIKKQKRKDCKYQLHPLKDL